MNLFFDTETTGVNKREDKLVQLAWILADEHGRELDRRSLIVKPSGYAIPRRASEVHGITTQDALREGYEIEEVLAEFTKAAIRASNLVAHNLPFDFAILETAYKGIGKDFPLKGKNQIDTMRLSTEWCRLPKLNGRTGFKYPRLEELYYRLFGESFHDAHDALADAEACMRSYNELVHLGVITLPNNFHKINDRQAKSRDKSIDEPRSNTSEQEKKAITDALATLTNSERKQDLIFVANHPDTNQPTLQRLIEHCDTEVQYAAASHIQEINSWISYLFFTDTGVLTNIINSEVSRDASTNENLTQNMEEIYETWWYSIFRKMIDVVEKDGHDHFIHNVLLEKYITVTSHDLLLALASNKNLSKGFLSVLLWQVKFLETDSDSIEKIEAVIKKNPSFCTQMYKKLLHQIYENWNFDSVDVDNRCMVVSDEECPRELLLLGAEDDFEVQEQVLLNLKTDEEIIKKLIKNFYKRLDSRDLSDDDAVNYMGGYYAHITDYPEIVLRINSMLTEGGHFPARITGMAVSEAKFRDVQNFL